MRTQSGGAAAPDHKRRGQRSNHGERGEEGADSLQGKPILEGEEDGGDFHAVLQLLIQTEIYLASQWRRRLERKLGGVCEIM